MYVCVLGGRRAVATRLRVTLPRFLTSISPLHLQEHPFGQGSSEKEALSHFMRQVLSTVTMKRVPFNLKLGSDSKSFLLLLIKLIKYPLLCSPIRSA